MYYFFYTDDQPCLYGFCLPSFLPIVSRRKFVIIYSPICMSNLCIIIIIYSLICTSEYKSANILCKVQGILLLYVSEKLHLSILILCIRLILLPFSLRILIRSVNGILNILLQGLDYAVSNFTSPTMQED